MQAWVKLLVNTKFLKMLIGYVKIIFLIVISMFIIHTNVNAQTLNNKSFQSTKQIFSKTNALKIDSILASMEIYVDNLKKSAKVLEDNYLNSENRLLPYNDLKILEDMDVCLGNIKQYITEVTDSVSKIDSIPNNFKYSFNHNIVGEPMLEIAIMSLSNSCYNIKYHLADIAQLKSYSIKQQKQIKSKLDDFIKTQKICNSINRKFNDIYMVNPELIHQKF